MRFLIPVEVGKLAIIIYKSLMINLIFNCKKLC